MKKQGLKNCLEKLNIEKFTKIKLNLTRGGDGVIITWVMPGDGDEPTGGKGDQRCPPQGC